MALSKEFEARGFYLAQCVSNGEDALESLNQGDLHHIANSHRVWRRWPEMPRRAIAILDARRLQRRDAVLYETEDEVEV